LGYWSSLSSIARSIQRARALHRIDHGQQKAKHA
jgi:hypothetical protein